eukprot:Sspe_Gene.77433::Locus_48388_Transcript_1_1_Confidence_1.000_Length_2198::g.77433::m.77433
MAVHGAVGAASAAVDSIPNSWADPSITRHPLFLEPSDASVIDISNEQTQDCAPARLTYDVFVLRCCCVLVLLSAVAVAYLLLLLSETVGVGFLVLAGLALLIIVLAKWQPHVSKVLLLLSSLLVPTVAHAMLGGYHHAQGLVVWSFAAVSMETLLFPQHSFCKTLPLVLLASIVLSATDRQIQNMQGTTEPCRAETALQATNHIVPLTFMCIIAAYHSRRALSVARAVEKVVQIDNLDHIQAVLRAKRYESVEEQLLLEAMQRLSVMQGSAPAPKVVASTPALGRVGSGVAETEGRVSERRLPAHPNLPTFSGVTVMSPTSDSLAYSHRGDGNLRSFNSSSSAQRGSPVSSSEGASSRGNPHLSLSLSQRPTMRNRVTILAIYSNGEAQEDYSAKGPAFSSVVSVAIEEVRRRGGQLLAVEGSRITSCWLNSSPESRACYTALAITSRPGVDSLVSCGIASSPGSLMWQASYDGHRSYCVVGWVVQRASVLSLFARSINIKVSVDRSILNSTMHTFYARHLDEWHWPGVENGTHEVYEIAEQLKRAPEEWMYEIVRIMEHDPFALYTKGLEELENKQYDHAVKLLKSYQEARNGSDVVTQRLLDMVPALRKLGKRPPRKIATPWRLLPHELPNVVELASTPEAVPTFVCPVDVAIDH